MPTSLSAPATAPAPAPTTRPSSGFKKIRPINAPQKPPPTAPARRQVIHLMQFYFAVLFLFNNDGVLKRDQIGLLHFKEVKADFLCFEFRVICDND